MTLESELENLTRIADDLTAAVAKSRETTGLTTRQMAEGNALGIPERTLVGVRAIVGDALFCRHYYQTCRREQVAYWRAKMEAYLKAAKTMCEVYR